MAWSGACLAGRAAGWRGARGAATLGARAASLEAGVGARLEERAVAGSALLPVAKYLFSLGGKSLRPRVAAAMARAANTRAGVSQEAASSETFFCFYFTL